MAQMCRGEYDPGMAQALLKAKVKLGDDEGSARLWARLTFNPINEEQPLVSVPWEGTRGLINALEAELDGLGEVPVPHSASVSFYMGTD